MSPLGVVTIAVIVMFASFAGGVLFSTRVLADAAAVRQKVYADAEAIKQHVTTEVAKVRSDVTTALTNLAKKL